jgi:hypothetical protein
MLSRYLVGISIKIGDTKKEELLIGYASKIGSE